MNACSSSTDVVDSDETPSTSKVVRLSPVPVETFDDYVVVGRLGTGGMAEVILALSRGPSGFRKLVAIKRLHEHLRDDPDAIEMFMHEARLTAGLHHANVVQVHKVGVVDGCPFMAMEYLDGQPINRVLRRMRGHGLPGLHAIVVRLMLPVLSGLHYVHEAKDYEGKPLSIVHRDISPQNIFVTFDGQVKLLDFGIAKAHSIHFETRSGLIKGKLGYIAPEQVASGQVDRRADLWSVGVTLWEGLSGARLFKGRPDVAAAHALHGEEIPYLSDVSSEVPAELATIVHKALCRDRDERYVSALAFSQALEGWLSKQPPQDQAPLASTLRALFADTIGQREVALRTCLATIEAHDVPASSADTATAAALRESLAPKQEVASSAPNRRIAQRSAIACAIAVAVGLGVWQVDDGDAVQAAHVQTSLVPVASQTAPKRVEAIIGAPLRAVQASAAPLTSAAIMGAGAPSASSPLIKKAKAAVPAPHSMERIASVAPGRGRVASSRPKTAVVGDASSSHAQGHLVLDSVPYAIVSLAGKRLGITPIEVDLPASKLTLELRNPERGIATTYQVQVVAGQTVSRRISLE